MTRSSSNMSGTTVVNHRSLASSSGSSSNSSRQTTPERFGDHMKKSKDILRVPYEENPSGKIEVINSVNKKTGQTVSVYNHGKRSSGH